MVLSFDYSERMLFNRASASLRRLLDTMTSRTQTSLRGAGQTRLPLCHAAVYESLAAVLTLPA